MAPIRLLIVEDDRQIAEIQKRFVERLEPIIWTPMTGNNQTDSDIKFHIAIIQTEPWPWA